MRKFFRNQKGQGIMEYVIISSLIGIVCLVAVKSFGEKIQTRISKMQNAIVKEIDLK